jgi:hypothetical protein
MVERLSNFPWVVVRVSCPLCPHRRGQYRLARLAAKFGPEMLITEVLDKLALDCPRRTNPGARPPDQYDTQCRAQFTDLEALSPPPPDLPPSMRGLRVIRGGRV